ncbi:glycosyltransferase [candidate division KSB1 bacterium]
MILSFLLYSFLVIFILYCFSLILINLGLFRLKKPVFKEDRGVTVIVPARNEEKNISECLECLLNQDYDQKKLEIIVIDDRSTDRTGEIIDGFVKKHDIFKKIKIEDVPDGISPKKNAVQNGVEKAEFDLILLTDADCRPHEKWVKTMQSCYEKNTGVVFGYSPLIYKKSNFIFKKFLYTDALSLAVISAGSSKIGMPLTCSGRNLSYRKEAFTETGGFGESAFILSGDDDLLMHRIKKKTKWEIKYSTFKDSINPSHVDLDFSSFINQRMRHSSKFKYHPFYVKLFSAVVFLLNLFILLFPLTFFVSQQYLDYYMAVLVLKFIGEYMLLNYGRNKLNAGFDPSGFIVTFILHPFYVVILALMGLTGKYKWK